MRNTIFTVPCTLSKRVWSVCGKYTGIRKRSIEVALQLVCADVGFSQGRLQCYQGPIYACLREKSLSRLKTPIHAHFQRVFFPIYCDSWCLHTPGEITSDLWRAFLYHKSKAESQTSNTRVRTWQNTYLHQCTIYTVSCTQTTISLMHCRSANKNVFETKAPKRIATLFVFFYFWYLRQKQEKVYVYSVYPTECDVHYLKCGKSVSGKIFRFLIPEQKISTRQNETNTVSLVNIVHHIHSHLLHKILTRKNLGSLITQTLMRNKLE